MTCPRQLNAKTSKCKDFFKDAVRGRSFRQQINGYIQKIDRFDTADTHDGGADNEVLALEPSPDAKAEVKSPPEESSTASEGYHYSMSR